PSPATHTPPLSLHDALPILLRYLGCMSGRVPSDPTLDDWFDEPQPRAERTAERVPAADDWLDGGGETRRERRAALDVGALGSRRDRESTRLNSSHGSISYAG